MTPRCVVGAVQKAAGALRAVLLVALVVTAASGLTATAAEAATIDCPNQSSNACKNTEPVVDCAWNNGDGTTSFVWGWDNPSSDTAHAVAGSAQNRLTPTGTATQPELFAPGRHQNAFWVTVAGSSSSWRLGNTSVTATSGSTPACATKPVPQIGSVGILLVLVLLLGLAALLVVVARPRRRPVEVR